MTARPLDADLDPGPPPPPPAPPASRAPGTPDTPGDADASPGAAAAPRGDRFFSWTAGLGVVRADGWLGGVAAGLAARMRVDPLIVRGILVVAALFGLPVLFLYALAWALLPDLDGRIPLRDLVRGRFEPAQLGILAVAIVGLLPVGPVLVLATGLPGWLFQPGYGGWPPATAIAVLFGIVGVALVAALVVLIVRAARRAPRTPDPTTPDLRTASADGAGAGESAAASGSGPDAAPADRVGVDAAGFAASTPSPIAASPESGQPDASAPADADADGSPDADAEYAAWREQHAAWKQQDDAWRRQQQDAARAAREQARRERQAQAQAFSAEASERRRIRRLTAPRTPFAYVAVVAGLAVVAGALAALTGPTQFAAALGLFVAALVAALGMVVAGAVRRRSGFLAFLTVLLLAGGAAATAVPAVQALHPGDYGISNLGGTDDWPASAPFVQPWGNLSVFLADTGRATYPIHVVKLSGSTDVRVEPGVELHVDITTSSLGVYSESPDGSTEPLDAGLSLTETALPDGRMRYVGTIPAASGDAASDATTAATTEQTLVIDQTSGWVALWLPQSSEESS